MFAVKMFHGHDKISIDIYLSEVHGRDKINIDIHLSEAPSLCS